MDSQSHHTSESNAKDRNDSSRMPLASAVEEFLKGGVHKVLAHQPKRMAPGGSARHVEQDGNQVELKTAVRRQETHQLSKLWDDYLNNSSNSGNGPSISRVGAQMQSLSSAFSNITLGEGILSQTNERDKPTLERATEPPPNEPRPDLHAAEIDGLDSAYQHGHLDEGEIRLLQLLPGGDDEVIKGEVFDFSLGSTCPPFYALSYTLDEPGVQTSVMSIYGQGFPIDANLEAALREIRKDVQAKSKFTSKGKATARDDDEDELEVPYYIWIDAICVDQQDPDERSYQLDFMRQIFQKAIHVIIWLGPASDDSDRAMQLIAGLNDLDSLNPKRFQQAKADPERLWVCPECQSPQKLPSSARACFFGFCGHVMEQGEWERFRDLFTSEPDDDDQNEQEPPEKVPGDYSITIGDFISVYAQPQNWQSLASFFARPWFTRSWTRQEFILASSPLFYCGSCRLSKTQMEGITGIELASLLLFLTKESLIDDMLSLPENVQSIMDKYAPFKNGLLHWRNTIVASKLYEMSLSQDDVHFDLFNWLMLFRSAKTRDPRDKVLSILSLSTWPHARASLLIDYRSSTQMVYCSLVKAMVSITGYISSVFQYCDDRGDSELPSWTPDWQYLSQLPLEDCEPEDFASIIPKFGLTDMWSKATAAWDSRAVASFSDDLRVLTIQGIELFTIQTVGDLIGLDGATKRRVAWATIGSETLNVNEKIKVGDLICVILGCDVPMALRKINDYYVLVGSCIVPSIMEGQLKTAFSLGVARTKYFVIH